MKKAIVVILIVLAVAGALGGGIFGIVKLTDGSKFDTKKISNVAFSVGGLDGSGKYMSTNGSIYTKEAFECQGLEASLSFDNSVEYQIYFYDQNNDFVHTTGKLSRAFVKTEVPFFAKYARIVITPKDDDVVSKLEVRKYAKQLTVKVNREQGFKNYTENLVKVGSLDMSISSTTGELVELVDKNNMVSEYINVTSYKECLTFRVGQFTDLTGNYIYLYDVSKNYVGYACIGENADILFTSSDGTNYYSLPLNKIHLKNTSDIAEFSFIRTSCSVNAQIEVYCR